MFDELEMTEQRQKVWDALKALDKERAKKQGAVRWPPTAARIEEVSGVSMNSVYSIMLIFAYHKLIDYAPGERLLLIGEPEKAEARA